MERRESHIDLSDKITSVEVSIATSIARFTAQHESIAHSIQELRKDQEKVLHILYGNGKEGIITVVAKIAQKLNLMWTIFAAFCGAVLVLSTGVIQNFVARIFQ